MQPQIERLAEHLQNKSAHAAIVDTICAILEQATSDMAQLPVSWHPLGFLLFRLGRAGAASTLRLHIWPRSRRATQDPNWPIHDHAFTLDSHILAGRLTNHFYGVRYTTFEPTHHLYVVEYEGDRSILRRTGDSLVCFLSSQTEYEKGEYYRVQKGQFHDTFVPQDGFAATIVLASDQDATAPRVLGDLNGEERYVYHRAGCELKEAAAMIALLRERMCRDHAP